MIKIKVAKKKKPTLTIKPATNIIPFSNNLSCEFRGNFPFMPKIKYSKVIENEEELKKLTSKMKKIPAFSFDTETNTLKNRGENKDFSLVGMSISWGEYNNYYIPLGHLRDEDLDRQVTMDIFIKYMKPIFARKDVEIFGWNYKFDKHTVKRVGIDIKTDNVFDGMIASWLCNENTPNGLKETSLEKLKVSQEKFAELSNTVPNDIKKQYGYSANSKVPISLVTIDETAPYAIDDAFFTWCNDIGYKKELEKEGMDKIYYKMYQPFINTLFNMEERGIDIDFEKLKEMKVNMKKDIEGLQYRIYELSGIEFNIGSSQQKAELLFGYRKPDTEAKVSQLNTKRLKEAYENRDNGVLLEKGFYLDGNKLMKKANVNEDLIEMNFGFTPRNLTKNGVPSTDNNSIWGLSRNEYKKNKRKKDGVELCKLLLEYSKLAKLKDAFIEGIEENAYDDGKIHTSFNIIGTDSGRLSSSQINLQQLPSADDDDKYKIRGLFVGSKYNKTRKKILAFDYHNLEMVCLTHFSGDKNLSTMFANGDDAHGSTAVNMFKLDCKPKDAKKEFPHLRQAAKTLNFLLMYGGGAKLLYETLRDDHYSPIDLGSKKYLEEYKCKNGVEVAQKFIDKYFESYSGVAEFIRKQKKFAHRNNFVRTILGRKRRLENINGRDFATVAYEERLSTNSVIQGTAADLTINAQLRVDRDKKLKELGCNMLVQVHDELVFECPEENIEKAAEIIKYLMEHPFGDDEKKQVKYLTVDWGSGDNYHEAK